ncbi:MAG: glycosyltransferase [Acidimicrobiales bacterium]|jgi:glycosyltransferase involved in cell wall biosynthesis
MGAREAMQPGGQLDLTVVVPYYNPGPNLAGHVAQVIELLRDRGVSFEVIAVSDGSTDGSDVGLADLGTEVQVVYLPVNQGKGHALRVGLGLGRGSYLGFIDGDGDIPAPVLGEFVSCIQNERPDFAIGSKRHPESVVVYPRLRRLYSWGYQVLTRMLFGLNVTDTQSGIKLARREIVTELLPILEEDGFTFDLELLAVARRRGYTRVVELPVEIRERFSSTVSPMAAWDMLVDTVRLTWRLRIAHRYDQALAARRLAGQPPRPPEASRADVPPQTTP